MVGSYSRKKGSFGAAPEVAIPEDLAGFVPHRAAQADKGEGGGGVGGWVGGSVLPRWCWWGADSDPEGLDGFVPGLASRAAARGAH